MCFEIIQNFTENNMTNENSAGNEKSELNCNHKQVEKKVSNKNVSMTMVLRSHKRKLAQAKSDNERTRNRKKKKVSDLCDTSDCIILSDSNTVSSHPFSNELGTSTPIFQERSKTPVNFDISCIRSEENNQPDDSTEDVIVISDTSTITQPVIVLSDEEEPEIQVISPETSETQSTVIEIIKEKRVRKKDKQHISVVNKNEFKKIQGPKFNVKRSPLSKMKFNSKIPVSSGTNVIDGRSGKKKRKKKHNNLCNHKVGENYYLDKPLALPVTGLRPIIIDGSNVAFHHSNNLYFSCRGLEICIKYFKSRGHEVIAFVPQYRVQHKKCDNPKLLDFLVKNGDVILTPSSTVNGNRIVPYDDRYIVQTAVIKGGVIVSRDNYRDLLAENPAWAETIQYRILQFTWVQDLLMFPNDPLGKRGPTLEEFLRFDSGY